MRISRVGRWRFVACLGGGLLAVMTTLHPSRAFAEEPVGAAKPAGPVAPRVVTLAEALQLAHEHQPALTAAHASVAAAQAALHGLEKLPAVPLLPQGKELCIRRKQASLGVAIAEASLGQAELDVVYAVRRTFYTVQYARAQKKVTEELLVALRENSRQVQEDRKREEPKYPLSTGQRLLVYQSLAQVRLAETASGIARATAAFREALGVGPEVCVEAAVEELPVPDVQLCLADLANLALARRAEVAQAGLAANVCRLEIDAQATRCLAPTMRTFAAGADIHVSSVPAGVFETDYRPGAIGLEYPTLFAGPKCSRVERAMNLSDRAGAVADKARDLVTLQVEDVYYRLQDTGERRRQTTTAAADSDKLVQQAVKEEKEGKAATLRDVLEAQVLNAQARGAQNEATFQYLLNLAALERVTAGGFCAPLPK